MTESANNAQLIYTEALRKSLLAGAHDTSIIIRELWPKIICLEQNGPYARYRVTMSPLGNLLAAILCGDNNADFHTGAGYLQTLTLVGMCSAVTSAAYPGYALAKIQPDISFASKVPIGDSVIMETRLIRERRPALVFTLDGHLEDSGGRLFKVPRTLTMVKIP